MAKRRGGRQCGTIESCVTPKRTEQNGTLSTKFTITIMVKFVRGLLNRATFPEDVDDLIGGLSNVYKDALKYRDDILDYDMEAEGKWDWELEEE